MPVFGLPNILNHHRIKTKELRLNIDEFKLDGFINI